MGRAALEARRWREARDFMVKSQDYIGLAKLEQAETGNDAQARAWLEAAVTGAPEPKWTCRDCGHAALDWSPLCRGCGVFNALSWGLVPEAAK